MPMKKHFSRANTTGSMSPISGRTAPWNNEGFVAPSNYQAQGEFGYRNYQYNLPEVYTGHPNRIERYSQYEAMDIDAEINSCLDILAEFCTQLNEQNNTPFSIEFREDPTKHEVELLKKQLQQWCSLNEFNTRMFKVFRNVLKYGDQVFVRDPENFKLYWVDMVKVIKVIVNESKGKEPEQYVVKDLNINLENLTVAQKTSTDFATNPITGMGGTGGGAPATSYTVPSMPYNTTGSRFNNNIAESAIDAKHIVHLSLTEGLDRFWPFGISILESIFKVYKQKELLEDAVLIYRISRAPERRVFKIDVGNMPTHMAMAYVERVKNEIHQRRIPSVHGGQGMVDATYNPLCLDLNTRIPLLDGRTLALHEIITEFEAGKENWAYSCDPVTGKIVPGVINWAGVTRKNTETIKITLDNGKSFICTPDHKIPVFGKGFVEAKNLSTNDSLIAFDTRNKKLNGNRTNEYQQVWDHETKSWIWTHRMVGEFFRQRSKHQEFTYLAEHRGSVKTVIHHQDYNRFNNDPRNLTYMNREDHILYHAANKQEYWATLSKQSRDQITSKISKTVKENWDNMSELERQSALYHIRTAQKRAIWLRQNDPDAAARYAEKQRANRKKYISENPEFAEQLNVNLSKRVKFNNQKLTLTFEMLQIVVDIVKNTSKNKVEVMRLCSENQQLMQMIREHNSGMDNGVTQNKIDLDNFGHKKMNMLLAKFGYKNWRHFVKSLDNFNHRIVGIELVEPRDTGTITIDGTERWHNYHTFAIDSGIFVKNSINEDYFFPITADARGSSVDLLQGGCFAMDTRVSLLDGRELSIRDIADELAQGRRLWTYSCQPGTGRVVPGLITWAGVTQKSARVLKITLDNGEHIICTPEHKFPVYEGEFRRADEFQVGDSMIPLYRRNEPIKKNGTSYEQYFDNFSKEWMFTHQTVADYLKDSVVGYTIHDPSVSNRLYEVRHHKDFNRYNNDPQNLTWMSFMDHIRYHADTLHERWNNYSNEQREVITKKMSDSAKSHIYSLSEKERQKRADRSRAAFRKANGVFNELMNSDPEFYRAVVDKRLEYWTEENRQQRAEVIREWNYKNWSGDKGKQRKQKHSRSQQIEFTHDMLKFVIGMVKGKTTHEVTADDIATALNESPLRDDLIALNKDKNIRNWNIDDGFTAGNIRRSLVQQFGYKSWKDFRIKESLHNHTVVSVEWLDEPIEVGTLTIDGDEIYHDYHTFALSVGVFTKNSNLGEIDDLKYFNNKMARGLRVPSSYLPTGPDDSERTMNDGRLGTALIQEFRFNQYCERLQNYMADKLDQEFKLFLRWRGFNIDSGLFRINFNAPQNFAAYRQTELDTARVNAFSTVEAYPYISKRFALKRFLGLSEEELQENDKYWREENDRAADIEAEGSDLRSIGISTSDLEGDLEAGEQAEGMEGMDLNMPPPGPELAPPPGAIPPPPAGAAPSAPAAPPV